MLVLAQRFPVPSHREGRVSLSWGVGDLEARKFHRAKGACGLLLPVMEDPAS